MFEIPKAIQWALRDRPEHGATYVDVVDGAGTVKHDDFIAFKDMGNGRFIREVHVYDMPTVMKYSYYLYSEAKAVFLGRGYNYFPKYLTSNFAIGSRLPTIKLETEFQDGKLVGSYVSNSSVIINSKQSMYDIDKQFLEGGYEFVEAVRKDPLLAHIADRKTAQYFASDLVREVIKQTNLAFFQGALKRGIPVIATQDGSIGVFEPSESNGLGFFKCTKPMQEWSSFVNLSMISAHIYGEERAYTKEELTEFAAIEDGRYQYRKSAGFQVQQVFPGLFVRAFDLLVIEKDLNTLEEMLGKSDLLAVDLLDYISKNEQGHPNLPWDLSRIRDITFPERFDKPESQVVVNVNGKDYFSEIVVSGASKRIDLRIAAAKQFWRQYFAEPDFSKWPEQEDLIEKRALSDESFSKKEHLRRQQRFESAEWHR